MTANQMVRDAAKRNGVKHWQIAEYLGISEPTIVRWLRIPLSPEKEQAILKAIEALAKRDNTAIQHFG